MTKQMSKTDAAIQDSYERSIQILTAEIKSLESKLIDAKIYVSIREIRLKEENAALVSLLHMAIDDLKFLSENRTLSKVFVNETIQNILVRLEEIKNGLSKKD